MAVTAGVGEHTHGRSRVRELGLPGCSSSKPSVFRPENTAVLTASSQDAYKPAMLDVYDIYYEERPMATESNAHNRDANVLMLAKGGRVWEMFMCTPLYT